MDEERLVVALEARIRDFEKNMKKAERTGTRSYQRLRHGSRRTTTAMERDMLRSTSRINQAVAATSTKIGLLGKAFIAGAVTAGTTALVRGSRRAVRSLAELGQQAQQAGVSVQALQELKFVGEQNQIALDAMVDGLKELQLRADEFIVTGKGPAAEAFARLGYGARDLERRLEDPVELFADLIGRMEDLDKAAQIRVADEIFGGSAGERFVRLLDQGEQGVRDMISRAHELGAVVDDEVITRAEELDRKFAEISARISTLAKTAVVNLADALDDVLTPDQTAEVRELAQAYDELIAAVEVFGNPAGRRILEASNIQDAQTLAGVLDEIDAAMGAFITGEKNAAEFEAEMEDLVGQAKTLGAELSAIDGQRFAGVIGGIDRISRALSTAASQAQVLRMAMPGGEGDADVTYGPQNGRPNNAPPSPLAPGSSPRPPAAPPTAALVPPTGGSRGGAAGGSTFDPLQAIRDQRREQELLREELGMTEAAIVAFRAEQEALTQAKREGIPVTDELRAVIKSEAESLQEAAQATMQAEARQEAMIDLQRDLASTAADWVMGIGNAEDALRSLARQLLEVGLQAALAGILPGTFQMPSFLGRRATGGPVRAGQPYLVNENTPRSEVFVPGQSGAVLTVPQAQAAMRQSGGGGSAPTVVNVPVNIVTVPGAEPEVRRQPGGRVDIDMRKAIAAVIEQGGADQAMRQRFGARPVGRGA